MGKQKIPVTPLVTNYRRRLVNVANELHRMRQLVIMTHGIPLTVRELLTKACQQVIEAYQLLPEE